MTDKMSPTFKTAFDHAKDNIRHGGYKEERAAATTALATLALAEQIGRVADALENAGDTQSEVLKQVMSTLGDIKENTDPVVKKTPHFKQS